MANNWYGANQNYGINNTNVGNDPWWRGSAGSVGHWNYKPTLPVIGTEYPGANTPIEETVNEDIHLDIGPQRPIITPNIPHPGKGFGIIPSGIMDVGRRFKGNAYYSEKFPRREFTVGDKTYTQSSLGGHYTPDEVFNMQEFGGVNSGDPRKDKWGKNIVSFADDYEEGLEDWVSKYGNMKYNTDRMKLKQKEKIAAWNQIQERRQAIEDANKAASAQHLASQGIQVGGGGRWEDPGQRDRGGSGAFREDVQSMRSAGRSYQDAQGNVGYSRGKAEGGRIGYREGLFVDEDVNIEGPGFDVNENIEMASDPTINAELYGLYLDALDSNKIPADTTFEMFKDLMTQAQSEDQGIASLV